MSTIRRIILCGDSMFIKAIGAALEKHPQLNIQQVNISMADLLGRIIAFEPDLVMVAEDETPADLALSLVKHGFPLVHLHPQRASLLTHQTVSLLSAADIEQLIEPLSTSKNVI